LTIAPAEMEPRRWNARLSRERHVTTAADREAVPG
jgi:hypothetical protein